MNGLNKINWMFNAYYVVAIGIIGLAIGSFLNVVVYRLPMMLRNSWLQECRSSLQLSAETNFPQPFNLFWPRSHCPHCKNSIRWRDNIPLLSFLWLQGKCAHCKQALALRYPLLELASMLVSIIVFERFGLTTQAIAALLFSWSLLALSCIDLEQQLLPDQLTLAMLWLGLLFNLGNFFTDIRSATIGAVAGYLILWSIAWVYQQITKKVGMGHGDFKLLAMLGAWLGWQSLPLVILIASLLGSIIGLTFLALKKYGRDTQIPFGPYLALAGWLALLWGKNISLLTFGHFNL